MTVGWGELVWGLGSWGTGFVPAEASLPTLDTLNTTPAGGAFGVQENDPLVVAINGQGTVVSSVTLLVNDIPAVTANAFQSGFTGTITTVGFETTITFATHIPWGSSPVFVYIYATNGFGSSQLFFTFYVAVQTITNLQARSWPDGKRIDLTWTNPPYITQILILRSSFSYCRFPVDPATTIYSGAPIQSFVDGPGLIPASYPNTNQSTTPLQENSFYYYTLFIAYDSGAPYHWTWSIHGEVEGLSLKDYYSHFGDYVYNLLPRTYRKRDADPMLGSNQFTLKRYCRAVLQPAVNLYRGWLEGLLLLRDPDLMPAGRLGVAENQTGILEGQAWSFGMTREKAFDGGVLRRIAMGLVPVLKQKGTCPGVVAITKLLTTWDSRCDPATDPNCGVDRLFYTWDTVSKINTIISPTGGADPSLPSGSITFPTSTVFWADGITPDILPPSVSGVVPATFILDAMGTYVCVATVMTPTGVGQQITFENPRAFLRESILGNGVGAAGYFTITSISPTSYPWQFPAASGYTGPSFGGNAWQNYTLKDSGGNLFPILSSTATASGTSHTLLGVTGGTPATGAFTLAAAFDASTVAPLFRARVFTGEFSLTLDPKWDVRLNTEEETGPWSLITALGAINSSGYAPTPADITVWVANVHSYLDMTTAVTVNTVTDSAASWTSNMWAGFYCLPNWNQTKVFKIIGNTSNTLLLDISGPGGGVSDVAVIGSTYVILTEENALMYSRLIGALPSFIPAESRPFVKFETTP